MIQIRRIQSGLTLVELMIVVAIIAVLASIALPAYKDYIEKTKVTQAITDISTIAAQVEAYWQDARAYPNSLADIGAAKIDPWGNAYIFWDLTQKGAIGKARKDKNLVPLNSDFDLYSMGKNGSTTGPISTPLGKDDILRANDGRFIDIASNY